MKRRFFIFDLDGTITSCETLPVIAAHFGIKSDIEKLTKMTVSGEISFEEGFLKRVKIMSALPVEEVSRLLEGVHLYPEVKKFIENHSDCCAVATGNLDCWAGRLCSRLGCRYYCSRAEVSNGRITNVDILDKSSIVRKYKNMGYFTVFTGDGANDLTAMKAADVSIAAAIAHTPARAVRDIADYIAYSEAELLDILEHCN